MNDLTMNSDPTDLLKGHQALLNVGELAQLLRLSSSSIYRLVERRLIPFYRLPRGLRFSRQDVVSYLQKSRVNEIG